MKKEVIIYTDGASRGNPGKGGWAAIVITDTHITELAGAQAHATNNQMELQAAIEGLAHTQKHFPHDHIVVHADSAYVLNGIASWVDGWKRNGWMTIAKKPVENRNQWEQLLELRDSFGRNLELVKVAGHAGEKYNERCDTLAVEAALGKDMDLFVGKADDYAQILAAMKPKAKKTKSTSSSSSSKKEAYSYVSYVGGKVYVDQTWAACEKRVKGTKGAKFKKVFSKAEETNLVQDYTLASLL